MHFLEEPEVGESIPGMEEPKLADNTYVKNLMSRQSKYRNLHDFINEIKTLSINEPELRSLKSILFTYTPAHEVSTLVENFNSSVEADIKGDHF